MNNHNSYRIADTHLRIGSKIHITDFVYAKRLFQKSVYSSKSAFSIANNISHSLSNRKSIIILIGYGYYSELLVTRTEMILKNVFDFTCINHILINNEKDINFDFHFKELFSTTFLTKLLTQEPIYYCVITPISSTLTTPIKIENEFYRQIVKYSTPTLTINNDISNDIFTLESDKKELNYPINNKNISLSIINPRNPNIIRSFKINAFNKFNFTKIPFQTMVVVGNDDINKYTTQKKTRNLSLGYWDRIEVKKEGVDIKDIITINRGRYNINSSDVSKHKTHERRNQFHIYVESIWYDIYKCELCFPKKEEDKLKEKPLFEVDETSVSPDLIFDYPKTPKKENHDNITLITDDLSNINQNPNAAIINSKVINKGHFRGNNKHFFYYLNYKRFYEINKKSISLWCNNLIEEKHLIHDNSRNVVLITPIKSGNGKFVFDINKYIFNESCNIISFDPHKENISNFEKFFSNWLIPKNRMVDVYYVDNLLAMGETALAVHDTVKLLRQKNSISYINEPGLSGIFTMINRLDYYNQENIKRKLRGSNRSMKNNGKIFAFSNIYLPVIPTNVNVHGKEVGCYLCNIYEKFNTITRSCSLDNIKQYIYNKKQAKLEIKSKYDNGVSIDNCISNDFSIKLLRLLITNTLFEYFSNINKADLCFRNPNCSFELFYEEYHRDYLNNNHFSTKTEEEARLVTLKVLSGHPFITYSEIKETVFRWVIEELDKTIDTFSIELKDTIKEKTINLFKFHYLRFLIKRAGQLNSSYVIGYTFLDKILDIINLERDLKDLSNNEENDCIKRILNFRFLVISAIKESLINNEPKAIKLEQNIQKLQYKIELRLHKKISSSSKYFLESLMLENSGVIRQVLNASEHLLEDTAYRFDNNHDIVNDKGLKILKTIFNNLETQNDNKIMSLLRFVYYDNFKKTNGAEAEELLFLRPKVESFFKTLALYRFLRMNSIQEKFKKPVDQIENAEYLLEQLCKILHIDLEDGGAFMLLKYQDVNKDEFDDENLHITASVGSDDIKEVVNILSGSKNTFLKTMLKGYRFDLAPSESNDSYTWTSITATLNNGSWKLQNKDDFSLYPESKVNLNNKIRRFHFIRVVDINYHSLNNRSILRPQAVLVFMDRNNSGIDLERVRYVLTIKNEISNFIKSNFENDAYKSFVKSEVKGDYFFKLNHGTQNYKNSVYYYLDEITETAYKNKPMLEFAAANLLNKIDLLSNLKELYPYSSKDENGKSGPNELNLWTIKKIVLWIKKNLGTIFTFEYGGFVPFDLSKVDLIFGENIKKIIEQNQPKEIRMPTMMIKDVLFEALINIRKHNCFKLTSVIEKRKNFRFNIIVELQQIDDYYYIVIENTSLGEGWSFQNQKIKSRYTNKGLVLLDMFAKHYTGHHIFTNDYEKDIRKEHNINFKLHIPIYEN